MATTVYVGLAVTSHVNSTLGTATFDNISFTGQSTVDTTPPVITNVTAANPNQNGATVNWTTNEPSSSQVDYGTTAAYGSSTALNASLDTSHSQVVAGLSDNTTYHYRVRSTDAAGNTAISSDLTFTTPPQPDTQAPTTPNDLAATAVSFTQVNLTWSAATDNIGVVKYILKRDGIPIAQPTGTSFSDTGRSPNTSYNYTIAAADAAGNISSDSTAVNATTPADTQAPTVPVSLTATIVSSTQVTLNWTASTDNAGVTGYNILRNGSPIGFVAGTSFNDVLLSPGATYTYSVTAQDAANNVSAASNIATVTLPTSQPLAIDVQVIKHGTTAATTVVSPALTTAGTNELLVAFVSSDGPSGSGTSTFTSVTGGGLTWTLRKRVNTQAGTSEIWTAPATAKLTNATITAARSGSYRSSMVVTAFKGADLTIIGAVGGGSAATGAPSSSLTTTRAGSWVWGVG
ncbi:MAG TPA: fibronectin type III domain-containing protein, partial [Candidatus Polarisedimenticolaceae bacterium]|nr:fibronectin type III domain-containing protein [Candidatus Polarisedimenticolaceae bacterium]